MKYELPKLPYGYDALEPFIDARTMELHHAKHHQAYVDKLNEALAKHPEIAETPLEELLKNLDAVPEDIRGAVKNHGGGHLNHSLFWTLLAPAGGVSEPQGELATAVAGAYGSFADFKKAFTDSALKVFGSGWTWLVLSNPEGIVLPVPSRAEGSPAEGLGLEILTTPNQDTPLSQGKKPVLALDVWEHAYYLKYQNRRAEYIENWWNIVDWGAVGKSFHESV
ncbi:MAG: superoxide dismutase [Patescibacteria group bacterium]